MSDLNLAEIEHYTDVALQALPAETRRRIYTAAKYVAVVLGVLSAVLTPLGAFTVFGFHLVYVLPYVLVASGLVHYLAQKRTDTSAPATAPSTASTPAAPAQ